MIADLKSYPAMKDSGVPSLGEIPEHWGVRRLRTVTDMRVSNVDKLSNDDEQMVRLCNYVDVYKHDRISTDMPFMRATASMPEIARFRLAVGDVLITKDSESWNDIGVPALVLGSADDLICGYHLALLRSAPELLTGAYLFRAIQSEGVAYQLHINANGVTRFGLSHSAIKSTWVPTPPLNDQAAIVRFLDYADGRIRRYIHSKQQLIKLLEEQIASRAASAMRHPSCRTERLATITTQHLRQVGRVDAELYVALGVRNRGRGLFHKAAVEGSDLGDSTFFWVKPGDLVISGQFAWEGAVALASPAERDTVVSHRYYLLRAADGLATTPYLWALLRSGFGEMLLEQNSRGAAGRNRPLNLRSLLKERVPVPPPQEQSAVSALLDSLAPVRDRALSAIALVQEYRTRLIADVVTGKLDVREAAAGLPDELDQIDEADLEEVVDDELADDHDAELEEVEV